MRIYALRDEANRQAGDLAFLECYERPRSFFFEIEPSADPWDLPFVLHEFSQRGSLTMGNGWSTRWVQSRLVPPERQNLGEVLRENGLAEYDETRLLELTGGRCSQDACYLVPVQREQLPAWFADRMEKRLADVYALGGFRIMAVFRDGTARIADARGLLGDRREFARVLTDEDVFRHLSLQAGGHGVQWGSTLEVTSEELRSSSEACPLDASDLALIAGQAVVDTAEAARMLGCTRQNISDLVRRGKLSPLEGDGKATLFLRADVLARR